MCRPTRNVSPPNMRRSVTSDRSLRSVRTRAASFSSYAIAAAYSRSVLGSPKCGKTLVSGKPVIADTRPPRSVRTIKP